MLVGPCSCGAWHYLGEFELVKDGLDQPYVNRKVTCECPAAILAASRIRVKVPGRNAARVASRHASDTNISGANSNLLLAYIGGRILSLMPCVLPVLFLKAMSMQRRSSQYVAGVMSVFFAFGVAATAPGFIWGGQFSHAWFTWGTAAVCFALGLTYFDVWHLPNVGFREAEGDFVRILTTILSSACSDHSWSSVRRLPHGAVVEDHHAVHADRLRSGDNVSVLPSEVVTPARRLDGVGQEAGGYRILKSLARKRVTYCC
jgi:hypothetical protein